MSHVNDADDIAIEDQFRVLFDSPNVGAEESGRTMGSRVELKTHLATTLQDAEHNSTPGGIGDRTESSVSSMVSAETPRQAAAQRDPRATRRGVVTYDDSPQPPVNTHAIVATSGDRATRTTPRAAADVPFLPEPGVSPMLEPASTLARSPPDDGRSTRSNRSTGSTDSRIRAKAGQLLGEKEKERDGRSGAAVASRGSALVSKGDDWQTQSDNLPQINFLDHIAVSPEQERQSKRDVEDVLSRLEGHPPNYSADKHRTTGKSGENGLTPTPVTEFSTRSTAGTRKTPITQFSSRGNRGTPAGFGSLYSPRHRSLYSTDGLRAAEAVKDSAMTPRLQSGVEMSTIPRSAVPVTQFSSRRSTPAPTLEPPGEDDIKDEDPERWLGSRPPSVISVSSTTSAAAKRRELLHALSSEEDADDTVFDEETSPPQRPSAKWNGTDDDECYQGMKMPPSGIRRMAVQAQRNGAPALHKDGKTMWEHKHSHRETSRRANGVSQAIRREWASQILGELKLRYDAQNRGVQPFFKEWRYSTELNNIHYHLLALETRRNGRSRMRRSFQAWHTDSHEIARVRNLIKRESRKFCLRHLQAHFCTWRHCTGIRVRGEC